MIMTIDFETYFDTHFSLKKQPMSEYVRDPKFKIFGAGVKINDSDTRWMSPEALKTALGFMDPKEIQILAHHAPFEGLILSHHFNFIPYRYLDTLAMARPLHGVDKPLDLDSLGVMYGFPPKEVDILDLKGVETPTSEQFGQLKTRAIGDVDRTKAIYDKMIVDFPELEIKVIDTTVRMFAVPRVLINTKLVNSVKATDEADRLYAIRESGLDAVTLRSSDKFAAALKGLGIEPPVKQSPTTGKMTWAFARTDLAFSAWKGDPELRKYYEARLAAKTTQTSSKTDRMLKLGEGGQRAPVMLNYCAAHTFRWGGGDKLNFQNIKRKSPLRRAIHAPLGKNLSVIDSSQIEARLNAWFAGQTDLLAVFAAGGDPYMRMARECFPERDWTGDDEADKETFKDERFIGKVCVLALGYQMGANKLRNTLAQGVMGPATYLSAVECKHLLDIYREKNAAIVENWQTLQDNIHLMQEHMDPELCYPMGTNGVVKFVAGGIDMPCGLTMRYPDLRQVSDGYWTEWQYRTRLKTGTVVWSKLYGGLLTENIIQSLARQVISEHIVKVSERYPVVLTVHDEIVTLIPEKNAEEHHAWIADVCSQAPKWAPGLPVACDGGFAKEYSK